MEEGMSSAIDRLLNCNGNPVEFFQLVTAARDELKSLHETLDHNKYELHALRDALVEIRNYCESQMGEWASKEPPTMPAEIEVLWDIIEVIKEVDEVKL
jgi:hypothetical protein